MTITPSIKKDYIINLAQKNKREDGRDFNDFRKITIEPGIISKAEGSARVKIGNTQVVAGIKMDIGEPYPDTPDQGVMTTAAELIPLASPDFESGPPQADAIELARVVDRGIRESEVLEVDKLCIKPGEKIWMIFVDLHIIDYDGNLFDAASLAALAALMTTKVPISNLDEEDIKNYEKTLTEMSKKAGADKTGIKKIIDSLKKGDFPFPISTPPISCTFVKFNGNVVIDPALDEEEIAEARLTVATDEQGDIRAMQKGLNGSFNTDEIKKVIKASINNGKKIREQLFKSVGK